MTDEPQQKPETLEDLAHRQEIGRRSTFSHVTSETIHPAGLTAYWVTNSLRAFRGLPMLSPAEFMALGGTQWQDGRYYLKADGLLHRFESWGVLVHWPQSGDVVPTTLTGLTGKRGPENVPVHPEHEGGYSHHHEERAD